MKATALNIFLIELPEWEHTFI